MAMWIWRDERTFAFVPVRRDASQLSRHGAARSSGYIHVTSKVLFKVYSIRHDETGLRWSTDEDWSSMKFASMWRLSTKHGELARFTSDSPGRGESFSPCSFHCSWGRTSPIYHLPQHRGNKRVFEVIYIWKCCEVRTSCVHPNSQCESRHVHRFEDLKSMASSVIDDVAR